MNFGRVNFLLMYISLKTVTVASTLNYLNRKRSISGKSFFKTAICSKWKELGSCPYGEKCRFAHGLRELRKRPKRHKKFNYVTCKNFLEGCCTYGLRCRFSHDAFEH